MKNTALTFTLALTLTTLTTPLVAAVSIKLQAGNGVSTNGIAANLPSGSLIQLIYSDDATIGAFNERNPFWNPEGDTILTNVFSDATGTFALGPYVFEDQYIGGYAYVRIFSSASPSPNDQVFLSTVNVTKPGTIQNQLVPTIVDVSPLSLTTLNGLVSARVYIDEDRDGIPDWWELAYTNTLSALSADTDSDGDGLTDLQEYKLQFNPLGTIPGWWGTVTNANQANDFAMANQGQVKWIATNAYNAFLNAPVDNLGDIQTMVSTFPDTHNYAAINAGQVKHIAQKFYDRIGERVGETNYPWNYPTQPATPNDYAPVNIGQLKYIFSFDPQSKD